MSKPKLNKYRVLIFYSGYIYTEVEAINEDLAIEVAEEYVKKLPEDNFLNELASSLVRWEEADTVEEIEND